MLWHSLYAWKIYVFASETNDISVSGAIYSDKGWLNTIIKNWNIIELRSRDWLMLTQDGTDTKTEKQNKCKEEQRMNDGSIGLCIKVIVIIVLFDYF